jgi:hypothetical protein
MAAYVYYIRRRIMAFFQSKKKGPAVVLPVSTKAGDSEIA